MVFEEMIQGWVGWWGYGSSDLGWDVWSLNLGDREVKEGCRDLLWGDWDLITVGWDRTAPFLLVREGPPTS